MDITVQTITPEIPASAIIYVFYKNVEMKDVEGNTVLIPQEQCRYTMDQLLGEQQMLLDQKTGIEAALAGIQDKINLINP